MGIVLPKNDFVSIIFFHIVLNGSLDLLTTRYRILQCVPLTILESVVYIIIRPISRVAMVITTQCTEYAS